MTRTTLLLLAALGLAACGQSDKAVTRADTDAAIAASTPSAPPAGDFDAVGTEPFWAVKVRPDSLTLSRPDHADLKVAAPKPEALGETRVWRAEGLNVSIRPRACSDGMSDARYVYEAEVRVGDEILKGCAFEAGKRPSAEPGS